MTEISVDYLKQLCQLVDDFHLDNLVVKDIAITKSKHSFKSAEQVLPNINDNPTPPTWEDNLYFPAIPKPDFLGVE